MDQLFSITCRTKRSKCEELRGRGETDSSPVLIQLHNEYQYPVMADFIFVFTVLVDIECCLL